MPEKEADSTMLKVAWALLVAFLGGILKRVANATWDDLWQKIFEGVAAAEAKWAEQSGKGAAKRKEVIDYIIDWIKGNRSLNVIELWVVRILTGNVVDAVVGEINNQLGKDWVKKAKEIEKDLAEWIPIIDGV